MGEISKDPKLGKKRLILFSMGSVKRYVNSKIEKTNLFCVFKTLKATNQLIITFAITT